MARDHARIWLNIWTDDDWRALPSGAQWLYMTLWTNPSLTFAGTVDWRPARIAAMAAETDAGSVEYFASHLEEPESGAEPFLVVDRDTEEAFIRSFVKHDGLLKSPNITVAMVNAYDRVASTVLRAVMVDQLVTLQDRLPDAAGWKRVPASLLAKPSMKAAEAVKKLPPNPSLARPSTLPP